MRSRRVSSYPWITPLYSLVLPLPVQEPILSKNQPPPLATSNLLLVGHHFPLCHRRKKHGPSYWRSKVTSWNFKDRPSLVICDLLVEMGYICRIQRRGTMTWSECHTGHMNFCRACSRRFVHAPASSRFPLGSDEPKEMFMR